MDAVNLTPGNARTVVKHPAILYPLMLIAAIAVIVFSVAGIATMMGWMPGALSSGADPVRAQPVPASTPAQQSVVSAANGWRGLRRGRVHARGGEVRPRPARYRPRGTPAVKMASALVLSGVLCAWGISAGVQLKDAATPVTGGYAAAIGEPQAQARIVGSFAVFA